MILLSLLAVMAPLQNSVVIETSERNGDLYCSVQAQGYPVHRLMQSLCRKANIELLGFEDIDTSANVTVYLEDRPLHVAVDYILGSAGLHGLIGAKRIDVAAASLPFRSSDDALQSAEVAYLSALQRFPEGVEAAQARLALADIALLKGEKEKAARHYELLVEQPTDMDTHLAARMKAGGILVDLHDWSRAIPHFRFVAESKSDKAIIIKARRQLARCVLMTGESQQALYMIEALNNILDPLNTQDEADRLMISARAKIGLGNTFDGLRDLDRAQHISAGAIDEFEGMDLRAHAMELEGRPVDAALGWVHFSRGKSEDIKREALVRAAKVALSVEGEELAVIFLWKHASNEELGDALLPYANEARARLGLDALTYSDGSITIRLNRATQLVDASMPDEAAKVFSSIEPEFFKLKAPDRIRFATTYAPLIENVEGIREAVDLLRTVVSTLESVDNRAQLYLLAGEIYERHGQFDEAAAAYGGEL
jgi:tetratricopeptide (TPR) repeat protein